MSLPRRLPWSTCLRDSLWFVPLGGHAHLAVPLCGGDIYRALCAVPSEVRALDVAFWSVPSPMRDSAGRRAAFILPALTQNAKVRIPVRLHDTETSGARLRVVHMDELKRELSEEQAREAALIMRSLHQQLHDDVKELMLRGVPAVDVSRFAMRHVMSSPWFGMEMNAALAAKDVWQQRCVAETVVGMADALSKLPYVLVLWAPPGGAAAASGKKKTKKPKQVVTASTDVASAEATETKAGAGAGEEDAAALNAAAARKDLRDRYERALREIQLGS